MLIAMIILIVMFTYMNILEMKNSKRKNRILKYDLGGSKSGKSNI